jgi:SSS family solute:Na+ symporter
MSAAGRTPLIGAYPKIFLPAIIIVPGLIGIATVHGLGGNSLSSQYNTAIPHLIGTWLPSGMLGIAITGLMAAFMVGVAANVSTFNTVVTYDIVQSYWKKDKDAKYYIRIGRLVTVGGILISIATAFIAGGVVLVLVSLVTKPKPEEELRGLVWGLTRKEEREANVDPRDKLWWRRPGLLAGVAAVLLIAFNITFI